MSLRSVSSSRRTGPEVAARESSGGPWALGAQRLGLGHERAAPLGERGHLVERRVATQDRRRVEHRLTSEGEAALARADAAVARRLDVIVDQIDDERATVAVRGVEHWSDALNVARERFLPAPPGDPDAPGPA